MADLYSQSAGQYTPRTSSYTHMGSNTSAYPAPIVPPGAAASAHSSSAGSTSGSSGAHGAHPHSAHSAHPHSASASGSGSGDEQDDGSDSPPKSADASPTAENKPPQKTQSTFLTKLYS